MGDSGPDHATDWLSAAGSRADFYSGKASDVIRALSLTCIAVVWLFAAGGVTSSNPSKTLATLGANTGLKVALWASIIAVILDVVQYILGALGWMLIRWCLAEILQRDGGDSEMACQTRFIWLVSRIVGIPTALAEALDTTTSGWPAIRDELRTKISEQRATIPTQLNSAGTDGPSNVFDAGTTLLFLLKSVAVLVAYIALATAVV
ncbi:hypothetical protein [Mycolicibacterium fluoranthenivorans]|uniref:Uncharacterized protein n=1 Tax=Mycolicibacterium fluoranthenivorans TaxID=258505 RepID=A0A1G4WKR1_9MYCO|nr:hypothetical protein [Mycolicibacterium fluoranthenivorans]SCX24790.1 hypothetical protein SAMN02799620_03779 [Mycolicibacterium fluoranthenivorans]